MSEDEKGFVVKDRRIFSAGGEAGDRPGREPEGPPPAAEPEAPRPEAAAGEPPPQARPPLPEINFATFIASLNASALFHLGVMEDPVTGKREKDLPMAKQTIDILSILQQKTAGNLTADEDLMLKNILYDLRILYVKERS
jgi:hypothetical protein